MRPSELHFNYVLNFLDNPPHTQALHPKPFLDE